MTTATKGQPSFRINNFDLLRLFAATQVLVFHTLHRLSLPTPAWLKFLELFPGVPIFFCVSGYLVSRSYERQDGRVGAYFRNRFLRIYPALGVCILLTVLVVSFFGYRLVHLKDFLWLIAQPFGLIYTPAFLDSFGSGTYNGSLWTIPLELQFYFMVPPVYFLLRRAKDAKFALYALFFLFLGISLVYGHFYPPTTVHEPRLGKLIRYTFVPSFYLFLLGLILQRLQIFRSTFVAGRGLFWFVGYILVATFLPQTPLVQAFEFIVVGVTAVSLAYTLPGIGESILHGQDVSYGVYIYHGLLINIFVQLHRTAHYRDVFYIAALAFVAATLSWRLVELPMLHRKYRSKVVLDAPEVATVSVADGSQSA